MLITIIIWTKSKVAKILNNLEILEKETIWDVSRLTVMAHNSYHRCP